jgi:hypothetical protein
LLLLLQLLLLQLQSAGCGRTDLGTAHGVEKRGPGSVTEQQRQFPRGGGEHGRLLKTHHLHSVS